MLFKENNSLYDLISKHRKELMGIAALFVLFDHCWIRVFSDVPGLFEIEYFMKEYLGTFGVFVFIFLSGFGLPNSYKKNSLKNFYIKRFVRIYITYFAAIIFYVLINKDSITDFLQQITMLTLFNNNYYPYLWFIPALFVLYLFFPLYYEFYNKTNNKVTFSIIFILIWCIFAFLFKNIDYEPLVRLIRIIPIFVFGILSNDMLKKTKINITLCMFLIFVSVFLFDTIENLLLSFSLTTYYYVFECSIFAVSFCSLYSYIIEKLKDIKPVEIIAKVFKHIGNISLELYCFQVIVELLIIELLSSILGPVLTNITFLCVNIIISLFVKFCVDNIIKLFNNCKEAN